MKHIVLFGAGKSATSLIDYLKLVAREKKWRVTIVDSNAEMVNAKAGIQEGISAKSFDILNEERKHLIKDADLVISMLPPALHHLVALDCLTYKCHLLTASYIDGQIKVLAPAVEKADILFLCEMGLDPGIDHMSAKRLIDQITSKGGRVISFKSHCGGLVAPESDDNPWHYKISWNPRNIVMAGKAGATYRQSGQVERLGYEQLFTPGNVVKNGEDIWAWYANRDSLDYIPLYGLDNVSTFIRTTLRHPDFCFGWKNLINLKLTDEEVHYDTTGMTLSTFFRQHFERHGFSGWLNDLLFTRLRQAKTVMQDLLRQIENEADTGIPPESAGPLLVNEKGELDDTPFRHGENVAGEMAASFHEANLTLRQLFFLGLDSDEEINKGLCSAADVLQYILETKLALGENDRDMIVMIHEIDYELNGKIHAVGSNLVVKGEDNVHTAMAKTVGLPLGIAARLILEGKINTTGLHIPLAPEIYNPILEELSQHGITFTETNS